MLILLLLEEQLANVEENLSKAGLFVVNNQERIIKIIGSIVLLIAIFAAYTKFIVEPKAHVPTAVPPNANSER